MSSVPPSSRSEPRESLLTLIKAQVSKYKSIEDSTAVEVAADVTVLVGKNESGKTAFLEALHKSLPLDAATFNFVADYPRKDYVRYRSQHEAKQYDRVVQLTFRIEKTLSDKINAEVFGGAEIISAGDTFRRNSTIGNTHSIDFSIDEQAALNALRCPFADLDHVDEVFDKSATLSDVLANIEKLKLPADHKLTTFVALWRGRQQQDTNGELVTEHIWRTYLSPSLPKFLYFDDYKLLEGKINLPALQQRQGKKQLTDADETALGLFELAGTSLKELSSDEGYETAKAKLEAISASITEKIFEFWKQNQELDVEFDLKTDSKDTPPYNVGPNLYVRIKNQRHKVTVPFNQRSKGFIWFFSFLVWFEAVQSHTETKDALILLLDEPGLNLHGLAQADFLTYIRDLSAKHQIIYTTHSPFMVDTARLSDVRVVEDRLKEGTKVTSELAGSSNESIFPLQAALGYSIAQNLFIAKKNILVEGPADLVLLQHVSALLETNGKKGLGDAILVPVGGLDKLATFVALLGSQKLKLVVLHDRASSPHQKLEDLVRQMLIERKRVLDFSMFIEPSPNEADIEDLLPQDAYITAFNTTYAKELNGVTLKVKDLGKEPRIVARINKWLSAKGINLLAGGGFNHYRVAQALLETLKPDAFTLDELARFERLFARTAEAL
ncbi:AAA family ATPase [Myxococcus sp. NMCA1]|uniref:AAA family ATPase n=1 Tax=Myxococcus sp. NMCA1 TaxID=2996785 RepID=UPI002285B9AC|nr:AAA family ATPase [Myxococcus sp. NMCA1]WAM25164.1 AAA family ATPase [Myxococcus sp. NMCA1]